MTMAVPRGARPLAGDGASARNQSYSIGPPGRSRRGIRWSVAQPVALDLARRGHRKRGPELDPARALVGREPLARKGEELFAEAGLAAGGRLEHHERLGLD